MTLIQGRQIKGNPLAKFLFSNTKSATLWLAVRLYVGWQWLQAGWPKVTSQAWAGEDAGQALTGFLNQALQKADLQEWYVWLIENMFLPHVEILSYIISWGELLVGVALVLGAFTGLAAFFGFFMNLNFLLAGTVGINPVLLVLSTGLMASWKVAGYIGLDRYLLPFWGTPWQRGRLFRTKKKKDFDM